MGHQALRGMPPLTYRVADLIPILKKNRDKHRATYEVAVKVYTEKCKEELGIRLRMIEDGKMPSLSSYLRFDLNTPVEYTEQYDSVIEMLELTTEETIELDSYLFQAWVQDKWSWADNFRSNTVTYSSSM